MSQQESTGARRSTRLVTATRRREMAKERARILGRRQRAPSALDVAAAQWEKEQQARARVKEDRLRASRQAETHPFSLQQVPLPATHLPPEDDEASWKTYVLPEQEGKRRRTRLGGIAVGSFATRLIQRERAGGRSRAVTDPRARALEEAARRWEEQRKASNRRR